MLSESLNQFQECPDCGVCPGEYHVHGCVIESCPYCGEQFIDCDGEDELVPLDDRLVWTGERPGVAECREFGWFNSDGIEDLERLHAEACWDRVSRRFVKGEQAPPMLDRIDFDMGGFLEFWMRITGHHCEKVIVRFATNAFSWNVMLKKMKKKLRMLETKGWIVSDDKQQEAEERLANFLKAKRLYFRNNTKS